MPELAWTDELKEHVRMIREGEVGEQIRQTAVSLNTSANCRTCLLIKSQAVIRFFRRAEADRAIFVGDPLVIDLFLLDMQALLPLVESACPWLKPVVEEASGIAERTRTFRAAALCALRQKSLEDL